MQDLRTPLLQQKVYKIQTKPRPIDTIMGPFRRFAQLEASGGILLLLATAAALIWANSPWEATYHTLLHMPLSVGLGKYIVAQDLHHFINDGLMCVFFFLVGLEIKREVLTGELSSVKRAALPFAAALGGVVVPALIYLAVNRQSGAVQGWAVPMATDIAFALGVLALLGDRISITLKVFVTALAIVDDIVAVLIVAIFYTSGISFKSLLAALAGVGISLLANRLGVRKPVVYALIGIFVWLATLKSGVHATIAGIMLAFTIPAETSREVSEFLKASREALQRIAGISEGDDDARQQQESAAYELERQSERLQTPLYRIEHGLQPWVSLVIMPVFALANAGVDVLGKLVPALTSTVGLGVGLGLWIGKPIGITLFSWLAVRSGMASKPDTLSWRRLFGASCLCGIGFTMSLFIANLAFRDTPFLDVSKIGTLVASLAAGLGGSLLLLRTTPSDEVST
jgi:NhaA family Na+:H+ antiporter